MANILRNIIALVVGLPVGAIVNGALIGIGARFIPPPEGVDPNDLESIRANIGSYDAIQFTVPFAAHALGTFVGALVVASIAGSRQLALAMFIGFFFLAGGITMVVLIPEAPLGFMVADLGGAYIPMAFLGYLAGIRMPWARRLIRVPTHGS